MNKECNQMSVGIIVKDPDGRILMIERLNFPEGWACPAGHVEDAKNTSDKEAFLNAAVRELEEETGLSVPHKKFHQVGHLMAGNPCGRGSSIHLWRVYEVQLDESPENLGSCEEDREKIGLVDFMIPKEIEELDLEPFWLNFFVSYNYINTPAHNSEWAFHFMFGCVQWRV